MKRLTPKVQIDERTLEYGRLLAENAALRTELVRWLEEIAGAPPEAMWESRYSSIKYVGIRVGKKDYEAARKRLEELHG